MDPEPPGPEPGYGPPGGAAAGGFPEASGAQSGAWSPQGYPPREASEDHTWAALAYVLALLASIIAPLVIYLVKMNQSRYVRFHASQSMNMGITLLIYWVGIAIVAIPLAIVTHGLVLVLIIPAIFALMIAHFVYVVLGAVRAGQGQWYQIPAFICLPLVR